MDWRHRFRKTKARILCHAPPHMSDPMRNTVSGQSGVFLYHSIIIENKLHLEILEISIKGKDGFRLYFFRGESCQLPIKPCKLWIPINKQRWPWQISPPMQCILATGNLQRFECSFGCDWRIRPVITQSICKVKTCSHPSMNITV